jgi:hypothetical protein
MRRHFTQGQEALLERLKSLGRLITITVECDPDDHPYETLSVLTPFSSEGTPENGLSSYG